MAPTLLAPQSGNRRLARVRIDDSPHLTTTFFLGGSEVPFWVGAPWFVQLVAFLLKTSFFLFLFLWVRWTLPRFRFDQLMSLGWKVMLPLALVNVFVTGIVVSLGG